MAAWEYLLEIRCDENPRKREQKELEMQEKREVL
jgi:hypothetical protein